MDPQPSFEGLTLREEGEDGVPVYELGQGS